MGCLSLEITQNNSIIIIIVIISYVCAYLHFIFERFEPFVTKPDIDLMSLEATPSSYWDSEKEMTWNIITPSINIRLLLRVFFVKYKNQSVSVKCVFGFFF
jgi:hypothetical protein